MPACMLRQPLARWYACVALATACLSLPALAADENRVIAVIVPAQAGLAPEVHVDDLGLIFWRKKLYAAHSQALHPVNLHSEHPLRLRFSQLVLHSTPKSQIGYWNGLYFHGVQPPYTVQSEEAMIRYVADTAGAIGYVDACHLDDRIRPLFWVAASRVYTEAPVLHCDSASTLSERAQ